MRGSCIISGDVACMWQDGPATGERATSPPFFCLTFTQDKKEPGMNEATVHEVDFAPEAGSNDPFEVELENLKDRTKQLEHVLSIERKMKLRQLDAIHLELQSAIRIIKQLIDSRSKLRTKHAKIAAERSNLSASLAQVTKQRNDYRKQALHYRSIYKGLRRTG